MASLNTKIQIEKLATKGLSDFSKQIAEEYRLYVHSVNIDWANTLHGEKQFVDIRVETSVKQGG